MDNNNNNYRLKRLRTLADVRDSGRRERWRQHKVVLYSLDSTASAPPIKHNPMGSTTSDRNRRNPSFIVFSDYEDDDDTKKLAKPEPKKQGLEPEPNQPHHYMAHVPDDIMSAILSRIPWKSISRLKCVSLYWYGLLNSKSPSLPIYSLCSKEPELLAGIFYQKFSGIKPGIYSNQGNFNAEKGIEVKFFTFGSQKEQVDELIERGLYAVDETMPLIPFNFYIEACRHGLLLCSRSKGFQFSYGHVDRHYVCNPITKKFIWLPNPPESPPHQYVKTGFLVNKESGYYQVTQFPVNLWADPIAKEGLVIVDLYSSLSRGWRTEQFKFHEEEIGRPNFYCGGALEGLTVQIGGSLYWAAAGKVVVCCNVEKEIRFVKQPEFEGFFGSRSIPSLCEFNGMLRYMAGNSNRVCLWDLQAGDWELVNTVCIYTITKSLSSYGITTEYFHVKPLALHCSDPEMVFLTIPEMIILYNFVSNKVTMIKFLHSSKTIMPKIVFPYQLPKMPLPVF